MESVKLSESWFIRLISSKRRPLKSHIWNQIERIWYDFQRTFESESIYKVINVAHNACEQQIESSEIARFIKNELYRRYGGKWHCFVGDFSSIAWSMKFEDGNFIHFKMNEVVHFSKVWTKVFSGWHWNRNFSFPMRIKYSE